MRVEKISDFQRFAQMEEEWNEALFGSPQRCVFLTHQWFTAWWQSFGKDCELEIRVMTDPEGSLIGAAPLIRDEESLRFMASHDVSDYCDVFFRKDSQTDFYKVLLDTIHSQSSDLSTIELINIPESSPTIPVLTRLASHYGFIAMESESEVAPVLSLPLSYEIYMRDLKRKYRHELRRKLRRMESLEPLRIVTVTDNEELELSIEMFIALHRESSPEKQKFWRREGMRNFFKKITRLFSLQNWIELNLLYSGDELLAALLNFSLGHNLYFYNVAYNQKFSSYSPGIFLFDYSIRKAIKEGKTLVDFLRGRERYKYYFGAKDSKIYDLVLRYKERER